MTKQVYITAVENLDNTDAMPSTCTELRDGDMVISRAHFIASITTCILTICLSLLAIAALLYREHYRRRQSRAAKVWGRQSRFNARTSVVGKACKAVDDTFSSQYRGCLISVQENPEMGSESPAELMQADTVWEVPALPPKASSKEERKSRAKSIFFDYRVGLWMPKR